MKKIILVIAAAIGLQACASTLTMNPLPKNGQKEIYDSGVGTIISEKKGSVVALRPSASRYESTQRPQVILSVLNNTSKPFDISTSNIRVFVDGEPTKVFTYEELVAEVKRKQTMLAIAAGLSAVADGVNAANAGYSRQTGTVSVYGNGGYRGYGTYSSTTYNAAAARQAQAAANARAQANFASISRNAEVSLSGLSATMLRRTTVMPHSWQGGYIEFDKIPKPNEPHEITIQVDVAGKTHEVSFKHEKVNQNI